MAITVFTGPPGAGKSHALVKDVILPAIFAGRRVLSNIDGLDPDAVRAYCLERVGDAEQLGQLVTFHGDDALKPGFWPDESTGEAATVVQGGDLVVFDEWALHFPKRGRWPEGCNVEPFLRWHRHLNGPDGSATDVAIGTQLGTDVHQNVRGLIVKTYKFRKLTAIGAQGQYTWQLFEGHLTPKGGHYKTGTGAYDKSVFPLYASSAAAREGKHVELRTNKKETIWSGAAAWMAIGAPLVLVAGGLWGLWSVWGGSDAPEAVERVQRPAQAPAGAVSASAPMSSEWRIVGHVSGEQGTRVIVADKSGTVRTLRPDGFRFDEGRPVAGMVDGRQVVAEDFVLGSSSGVAAPSPFGGNYR